MFFGRNDVKAETPVFWPPHAKSWLIRKDSDAGRDWGQEEKGTTEDEMDGWHHRLDGREFELTSGVGDGQWGLACCDSWGHKESDTTEWLNWTELMLFLIFIYNWWLLYNIGLISVIHQHELIISVHMSPSSRVSLPPPAYSQPSMLLQSPHLSSLS